MASSPAKSDIRQTGRQLLTPGSQGKHPHVNKKERSQRSICRSASLKEIQRQPEHTVSKDKNTEPNHPFPSPSASNSPSEEVIRSPQVFLRATGSPQRSQRSTPDPRPKEVGQPGPQNGHETSRELDPKRKRSYEAGYSTPQVQEEPTAKRARTSLTSCTVEDKVTASNTDSKSGHPIEYWIKHESWPKEYFEPDPNMSQQLSRKRASSVMSYTQSVKEGENPPAHTPEYERQVLARAGIQMDHQFGEATILDECKRLCTTLLDAKYEPPEHSLFQDDLFWKTINRLRSRSEAKVMRDLTPHIVPSVELLFIRGDSELEHMMEEIQAEWSKCTSLAGPQSKPDLTVGFSLSAFTDNEIQKLKYYRAPERPTLFTGSLYFPFLMCEVKCGEKGLNSANRQNARSASTAVNAILQLYRTVSRIEELHRKILVFSISHDHAMVKIYGHYALINGDKTTFHRYLIRSLDLTEQDGKEKWTAYNFTRKVYDHFAPIFLKTIRDAISHLREPESESFMSIANSENESGLADSQEMTASVPSSQGNAKFKKPRLPPKAIENERLTEQNKWLKERMEQQDRLIIELSGRRANP